ncbi:cytochrome P450 71A1-like isoform X2 [Miscanthus floridulus]|uniref:cytochrome P450 71A1-like isoform X2 n=1 Tax=Miscanthus floridulus TaxID=154761 RepID=UPI003459BFB2
MLVESWLMAPVQLDYSNLLLSVVVLAVSCFVIVRSFRSSGRKDGSRVLPPSPPALPIIGNLHQLGRSHHYRTLLELARRHGPLFLLHLGSVPTRVVSSASMAEEVLKAQDHVFCGRPQQHTARGLLYGCRDVAFSAYGERWRQLRRIAVVHLLSAKRVDSFRVLREEAVASFVDRVRAAASAHVDDGGGKRRRGVNVSELFISLTYTVISKAAFGSKLGGMEPGAIRAMMMETSQQLETIAVSDVFPCLRWVDWATGLDARTKRTARKLDAVLEVALQEHEKSSGRGDDADDLLDDLLSAVEQGGAGLNLDRTDVKGLIIDLFLAGTDTTSKTMEWTMAELVKNPKEMEKVQAELRQIVGEHGRVTEELLSTTTRPQAAIKEALRLHAPVPMLVPREAVQDTKLHGYDIPAKTQVLINAWAIGRDEESWEDADAFRPERFVHTNFDYSGKDFRFIPFGAGRRGCPGIGFGTRLAELALANLLYHFDWELPDDQDLESFEVVESSGLSPGLKYPLTLVSKTPQA